MPRDWAPASQRLRRAHRSPVSTPPACWQRRASCAKLRQASPRCSRGAGSPDQRGLPLALPECAGQRGEWSDSLQANRRAASQRTGLARPAQGTQGCTHTSPNLRIRFGERLTLHYRIFAWHLPALINISRQPEMQERKRKNPPKHPSGLHSQGNSPERFLGCAEATR